MTMPVPVFSGGGASFDFVTNQGQAAQAVMPQVGYVAGSTLSAVFNNNNLAGTTITAGTVTVNGTTAILQLSSAEVDEIKDAAFQVRAGTVVVAQGKVHYQPKPYLPEETQIVSDLAPVAKSGNYADLIDAPDLTEYVTASVDANGGVTLYLNGVEL